MLWSQGRGRAPGGLCRLGMALEGFENSLYWASEHLGKGGFYKEIPWDPSPKAKAPCSLSRLRCVAAWEGAGCASSRQTQACVRPSVCRLAPVPAGGSVRALNFLVFFFNLAVKKTAWLA